MKVVWKAVHLVVQMAASMAEKKVVLRDKHLAVTKAVLKADWMVAQ
jgi:hypothetical protein